MKVTGSRLAKVAFKKLWRLSGQPQLRLIKPLANWTVAAGLTYNPKRDQFLNVSNVAVAVDWSNQPCLEVDFLPKPQQNEVDLGIPGVMTLAKTNVTLLWTTAIEAALKVAWGVVISDKLYRVDRWQLIPLGVPTPNSIDVELVEAKK